MAWHQRQLQILFDTYVKAWHVGAANYRATQHLPTTTEPVAATVMPQPKTPDRATLERALAPAMRSLSRMAAEMVTLAPGSDTTPAGIAAGIVEYVQKNSWRVDGGKSVAWAGEQAGYAEAAAADRALLAWELDPAVVNHCADCPALAALPPMPLDQWPTVPGGGATECGPGCRCSFSVVAAPEPSQPPKPRPKRSGSRKRKDRGLPGRMG